MLAAQCESMTRRSHVEREPSPTPYHRRERKPGEVWTGLQQCHAPAL